MQEITNVVVNHPNFKLDNKTFSMNVREIAKKNIYLLCTLILYVIILLPILHSSQFVPFIMDGNESFSSMVHASNIQNFGLESSYGLTDEAYGPNKESHPYVYTHQGNFPRIFAYFLNLLGADTIESQILITTFSVGLLAILFAFYFFSRVASPCFGFISCSVLLTSYILFTQWHVVTFRVWHAFFFFSSLLLVHRIGAKRKIWNLFTIINYLCLFYFEFVFAVYVFLTASLYTFFYCFKDIKGIFRGWVLQSVGAFLGVLILVSQIILYLGWNDFVQDVTLTFLARNYAEGTTSFLERVKEFYENHNIVFWYNLIDGRESTNLIHFIGSFFYWNFAINTPLFSLITFILTGGWLFKICLDFPFLSNKFDDNFNIRIGAYNRLFSFGIALILIYFLTKYFLSNALYMAIYCVEIVFFLALGATSQSKILFIVKTLIASKWCVRATSVISLSLLLCFFSKILSHQSSEEFIFGYSLKYLLFIASFVSCLFFQLYLLFKPFGYKKIVCFIQSLKGFSKTFPPTKSSYVLSWVLVLFAIVFQTLLLKYIKGANNLTSVCVMFVIMASLLLMYFKPQTLEYLFRYTQNNNLNSSKAISPSKTNFFYFLSFVCVFTLLTLVGYYCINTFSFFVGFFVNVLIFAIILFCVHYSKQVKNIFNDINLLNSLQNKFFNNVTSHSMIVNFVRKSRFVALGLIFLALPLIFCVFYKFDDFTVLIVTSFILLLSVLLSRPLFVNWLRIIFIEIFDNKKSFFICLIFSFSYYCVIRSSCVFLDNLYLPLFVKLGLSLAMSTVTLSILINKKISLFKTYVVVPGVLMLLALFILYQVDYLYTHSLGVIWKFVTPFWLPKLLLLIVILFSVYLMIYILLIPSNESTTRINFLPDKILMFLISGGLAYCTVYYLFPGYIKTGYLERYVPFGIFVFHTITSTACFLLIKLISANRINFISGATKSIFLASTTIFVISVSFWLNMQYKYIDLFSPSRFSFLPKLREVPFYGASFVSNTYAAPVYHLTNQWAYFDPNISSAHVTISNSGYEIQRDMKTYTWLADRDTNPHYSKPDYYICMMPKAISFAIFQINKTAWPNCSDLEIVKRAKKNGIRWPVGEIVAEDNSDQKAWAIVKLDWVEPPILRKLKNNEYINIFPVLQNKKLNNIVLDLTNDQLKNKVKIPKFKVDYIYHQRENHKEDNTIIKVYANEGAECTGTPSNLLKIQSGKHLVTIPSHFKGNIQFSITPVSIYKEGEEYFSNQVFWINNSVVTECNIQK